VQRQLTVHRKPGDKYANAKHGENRYIEPPPPRRQHACPPLGQNQSCYGGEKQHCCEYQRTALQMLWPQPDYGERGRHARDDEDVGQLMPASRGRPR
jgi:hypothetical protein